MDKIKFCENLKGIRKVKRKTQRQLAMFSGLSQSYISDLERGTASPTLNTLEQLSKTLKVSIVELLF